MLALVKEKRCPDCGIVKSSEEFWKDNKKAHGMGSYCKPCSKERNHFYYVEKFYGMKHADWMEMFNDQDGRCKVCSTPQSQLKQRLCVEHCHDTMRIRGLVCKPCNTALGLLNDNPELLRKAAEYLEVN